MPKIHFKKFADFCPALGLPNVLALAGTWVVQVNPAGAYDVTDHVHGNGTIHTNGLRTAKRVAGILNRATGFVGTSRVLSALGSESS